MRRSLRLFQGFQSNITPSIQSKVGQKLHLQQNHPLNIIKNKFEHYYLSTYQHNSEPLFKVFDDMEPKVNTTQCFDDLLVKPDHPSRSQTDTYYYDEDTVLRTHTSAHQTSLLRDGNRAFLASGDCYRRDEIDSSHYPVFHQMEGVRIWNADEVTDEEIQKDLKDALTGMVHSIFGKDCEMKWSSDYFPFTDPSFELEVLYDGKWLEVLGCGQVHPDVLKNAGLTNHKGWAFGIGLERLAMILFNIPDIRLFWSQDPRFLSQFKEGEITTFQPFSKYPPCFKDISAWIPENFHDNDICSVIRDVAGDMVENVDMIDEFTHPKTNKTSRCYRITYRSLERSLTNEEVDELQMIVRERVTKELGLEIR